MWWPSTRKRRSVKVRTSAPSSTSRSSRRGWRRRREAVEFACYRRRPGTCRLESRHGRLKAAESLRYGAAKQSLLVRSIARAFCDISAATYGAKQRQNLAVAQVVLIPAGAQNGEHHGDRAVQYETRIALDAPPYCHDEVREHRAQPPQKRGQRRQAALRCILQIDVVQMDVRSRRQGARNVRWNIRFELRLHLFRTESQERMRFDHLPRRATADHAELVRIHVACRLLDGPHAVANARRIGH